MILVKIGSTYLNMEHAIEIRDTGVDVEVFFRDSERATTLRGAEADRLRDWLETQAEDLDHGGSADN